jgi:hypothetical protein
VRAFVTAYVPSKREILADGRRIDVEVAVQMTTEGELQFVIPSVSRSPVCKFDISASDLQEVIAFLNAQNSRNQPAKSQDS